jgi:histidinol-phosphate aminotransferase
MTNFNLHQLIRPHLLRLNPYSTARDEYKGKPGIFLDANENPYPGNWNRYPDPHQVELKKAISSIKNISAEQIFIGNGSDEVIDLMIRLCCEPGLHAVITTDPTYSMYQVSAQINGVEAIKVPLKANFGLSAEAVLQAVYPEVRIIFLCSPNNPSGNLLEKDEVRRILRNFNGIVVVDEAYIDFADDGGFLPELNQWPNLVVMQTLSKAWGLAGLRLGMAFGSPELIAWLNKIKPPYNISQAAQQFALQKLRNHTEVAHQINEIKSERNRLARELTRLPSVVKVFTSQANFLLVQFTHAGQVYEYLLQHGIIVRNRSNVLHGHNCLRITVGTPEENNTLIRILQHFIPKA